MYFLPGEKVHMALNGTKKLEWLTLCFWKKSNQPGVNINYRVHIEKNDTIEILEKKNSLRFVLMAYNRYECIVSCPVKSLLLYLPLYTGNGEMSNPRLTNEITVHIRFSLTG